MFNVPKNSAQMKFPFWVRCWKIAVHLSSAPLHLSPDPALLRVICSPLLLLPAAPLSLTPPPSLHLPPLSCPLPLCFPSPLLSTSSVLSSPPSPPPLPPPPHPSSLSSVRFVLQLQRLNLLAKHTKSHTCKCTQEKKKKRKPISFFTVSQTVNIFWALHSLSVESRAVQPLSLCLCNRAATSNYFRGWLICRLCPWLIGQLFGHQSGEKCWSVCPHLENLHCTRKMAIQT